MKRILLTQGKTALVSNRDYWLVRQFRWFALRDPRTKVWYARCNLPVGKRHAPQVLLHRLIAGFPPFNLDHRNRDGLDCRRSNLRPATPSQNNANREAQKNNSGPYKGAYRNGKGWIAKLGVDKQVLNLGTFNEPEEAAIMRNFAALHYYGEYAA